MKKPTRRFLSLLLCAAMLLTLFLIPGNGQILQAHALEISDEETAEISVPASDAIPEEDFFWFYPEEDDLPSNDDMFTAYLTNLFYPDEEETLTASPAHSSSAAGPDSVPDQGLQDMLGKAYYTVEQRIKAQVQEIAAGTRTYTDLSIDISDLNLSSDDFSGDNWYTFYYAIRLDCGYELYWSSLSMGLYSSEDILYVRFPVDVNYRKSSDDYYTVDTTKIKTAQTSLKKAQSIVSKYASYSDYDKLVAYKNEICNLNDYNYDAISGYDITTQGSDPWQIIYVFDEDSSTNVVCEGYAKAFEYLCNQSTFESSLINCYCVTGSAGGAHMWNILTMDDGRNYHVDVTWCDGGWDLFIVPCTSGNITDGFTYLNNSSAHYTYDDSMFSLFTEADLTISPVAYGETYSKPKITTQPTNQTVLTDDTAKFTVKASGSALSYQWYWRKNSSEAWAKSTASGNATATLSIKGLSYRNGYQYRCALTNPGGTVYTKTVKLTVTDVVAPSITTQPGNKSGAIGSKVKFTVKADGDRLTYQWYWRKNTSEDWAESTMTGYDTATLTVPVTAARQGYQYRCLLKNSAGSVYTNAGRLNVTDAKPAVTVQPASKSVYSGHTVKFTVTAGGTDLKYQWYWRKNSSASWAKSTMTGCDTASLSVPAETTRDGYQYRCLVKNSYGSVYSSAASLKVTESVAPKITTQPSSVSAIPDETATFTVKATGTELTYQWYWRKNSSDSWTASTMDGYDTKTLTVPATAARNGYQYRCRVKNVAGTVYSKAATLTVEDEPPKILSGGGSTYSVSSYYADNGYYITFSITTSGSNLKYQWYWRKSSSGSWTECTSATVPDSSFSVTEPELCVELLSKRDGYQYRCKVYNSSGAVYSSPYTLSFN